MRLGCNGTSEEASLLVVVLRMTIRPFAKAWAENALDFCRTLERSVQYEEYRG